MRNLRHKDTRHKPSAGVSYSSQRQYWVSSSNEKLKRQPTSTTIPSQLSCLPRPWLASIAFSYRNIDNEIAVVGAIKNMSPFMSVDPCTHATCVFNSTSLCYYFQRDLARHDLFRLHLRYQARKQYPTNFGVCWSV